MGMNLWMSCPRSITATCWVTELHISGAGYQMFLLVFLVLGWLVLHIFYIWANIWVWLSIRHLIWFFFFFFFGALFWKMHSQIHCDFFFFPVNVWENQKKISSRVKNVWRCSHCVCLFSKYLLKNVCFKTKNVNLLVKYREWQTLIANLKRIFQLLTSSIRQSENLRGFNWDEKE